MLKELDVYHCHKLKLFKSERQSCGDAQAVFSVEEVMHNLEQLALSKEDTTLFGLGQLGKNAADLLQNLKFLKLQCFHNDDRSNIFSSWLLQNPPNIEKLGVVCSSFNEIFSSQTPSAECSKVLSNLKGLNLNALHNINSIGLEHSWVEPLLKSLETLEVWVCSSLKILVPSTVSFSRLTVLSVLKCHGLEYLLTSSTAKSLGLLKKMSINECKSIKEIVAKEGDCESDKDEIIFDQLNTLSLHSLPRLVAFYTGMSKLEFPSLQNVSISECCNMSIFCKGDIRIPSHLHTQLQKIFQEMVETLACDIQYLKFGDHPGIEEIWVGVVPIPSNRCFNNLKSLTVVNCESLSNVIPFNMLPFLCNLEEMKVSNCLSVKAIFDVKDVRADGKMINMEPASLLFLPLKKLTLNHLPNLEHIWNMNPDGILGLQDLQEVCVYRCQSLESLFQTSVANHLVKLDVKYCERLEKIVAEEEAAVEGEIKQFVFHCLTSLTLWQLPELKCIYPERQLPEWPMLKELVVYHCQKLKLFTTEHQSCGDPHREDQLGSLSINQQAIISAEKVFPHLEQVALTKEDTMLIGQGQFGANVAEQLQNLKYLILHCFHEDDQSNIFSCEFLQNMPSIEKLGVGCSSFNEIFSSQRPGADCSKMFPKLKGLLLTDLRNLNSIGLEHSWVEPLLKNLEKLEVSFCSRLKMLVPRTLSFSNLTFLSVSECHGLEYLFTSSTAKSLGLLKQMFIWKCESIKEIVAKEGDSESDQDEITFRHLNALSLHSLPRLVAFYTGTSKLQFSTLQTVSVTECRSMSIFCKGDIWMPSHLNTLLQKIFQETVANSARDKQYLRFGDRPGLEEIWLGVVPIPTNRCFNNLKSLIVVKCESLSNVIPFNLLPFLCNLEEVEVSNCVSVEAIFDVKGVRGDRRILDMESPSQLSLPLKKLTLNHLPNLEHIWNMNPDGILCLQDLREVYIDSCQTLKSLFQTSVANHLVKLDVKDCEGLVEIVSEDIDVALKGETKQVVFHCLASLTLVELPELKYIFSGKHSLEWPMLKELYVYHCQKLKLSTAEYRSCGDTRAGDQLCISIDQRAIISVEKVAHLKFGNHHPMLEKIWLGVLPVPDKCFGNLKSLVVDRGQLWLNKILPSHLIPFLLNLEELNVRGCYSVQAIFDVKDIPGDDTKVINMGPASPLSLPLKKLVLDNLPSLKHIWNQDPQGILSLPFLQEVLVNGCHSLKSLFPASAARDTLEKLDIRNCVKLEEIVEKDETATEGATKELIMFPSVSSLTLRNLPKLKCIYPGMQNLEWPMLKELDVYHCDMLKIFPTESQSSQDSHPEGQDSCPPVNRQALISVEKGIPYLEQLTLREEEIVLIEQGQFLGNTENLLQNVKFLKLQCFHNANQSTVFPFGFLPKVPSIEKLGVACNSFNEIISSQRPDQSTIFPFRFLQKVTSIEKLGVACSSFNEIFSSQRPDADCSNIFSKLKGLLLTDLRNLDSIGLEHYWVEPLLKTLETLEVLQCWKLKILVPSTVSFSKLTDLIVSECNGLVCLFTSSTAKSLCLLKQATIRNCFQIKEIVGKGEDHESDEDKITFDQLSTMSLHSLPSLVGFYMGSCRLEFPSLQNLTVSECRKMKIFCEGDISVPQMPTHPNSLIRKILEETGNIAAPPSVPWMPPMPGMAPIPRMPLMPPMRSHSNILAGETFERSEILEEWEESESETESIDG